MFNKKILNRLNVLQEKIDLLEDKLWHHENPYGKIKRKINSHRCDVFYKPNRTDKLYLCSYLPSDKDLLICKIKKIHDDVTYIVLEYSDKTQQTYIVEGNISIKIDNPLNLTEFDIEIALK